MEEVGDPLKVGLYLGGTLLNSFPDPSRPPKTRPGRGVFFFFFSY